MKFSDRMDDHFLIVFWLGLLAGALLVTLLFTYQAVENQNYENTLLRLKTQTQITMPNEYKGSTTTTSITMPNE
jgi:uncharacterized protein YktB (UPF0637 family)